MKCIWIRISKNEGHFHKVFAQSVCCENKQDEKEKTASKEKLVLF